MSQRNDCAHCNGTGWDQTDSGLLHCGYCNYDGGAWVVGFALLVVFVAALCCGGGA